VLHQVYLVDGVPGTSGIDASATEGEDIADGVVLAFHTHVFFTDLGDKTVDDVFPEGVAIGICHGGWFFQYPARVFPSS
jgi:hypothetical protein